MSRGCIIVYAKAPRPGHVKTRLIPRVGPEGAAALHEAFVCDLLPRLTQAFSHATIELHTDVTTAAWPEWQGCRRVQPSGDLGERLLGTLRDALQQHGGPAMVVGSDAPTLPMQALGAVLASDADVTLGPAEDGGYYAISCRRMDRRMFAGVPWSASDTAERTAASCAACGLSVHLTESIGYDVDTPEDLMRLAADRNVGPRTRAVLHRLKLV